MTNGEEEKKEGEEVSNQGIPEAQPIPEAQQAPEVQPAPEAQQAPGTTKKKSSNTILIVVAVIAVCCIGAAVVLFTGAITFSDFMGPTYNEETIGGHVFKIPTEFKKDSSKADKIYEQFINDDNQFIRIQSTGPETDLYDFALWLSLILNGAEGKKVSINGTSAYRFNAVDTDGSGQSLYLYAVIFGGDSYVISVSKNIQNPDEFVANVTNSA